ncbi:MAG: hypothetical protein MJ057_06940 [Sphaerochaetaceae bacterium]|nr:hypothetical protein [Sphaerochaetaceae bacterium]
MADLKSMLKSAVTGAVANGGFDLAKVSSLVDSVLGYEQVLTSTLGQKGSGIVDAAKNVKAAISGNLGELAVKKAMTVLKTALDSVQGNAICLALSKKLEAMGV